MEIPGTIVLVGANAEQRAAVAADHAHADIIDISPEATDDEIRVAVSAKRLVHLETRIYGFKEPVIGFERLRAAVAEGDEFASVRYATFASHGHRWAQHAVDHCVALAAGKIRMVSELENGQRKIGLIVGSGPSLGRRSHVLREVAERCTMAVCDTAVSMVRAAGCVPDIVCSIESNGSATDSIPPAARNEAFLYGPQIPRSVVENMESLGYRCFLVPYRVGAMGRILARLGEPPWSAGGSVATACYVTLAWLGCSEIWGVGVDCCLDSDGRFYPPGIEIQAATSNTSTVPGRDTPEVTSTQALRHYLAWFGTTAKENPKIRHVNASVGGALIKGWERRELHDLGRA